MRSIWNGAISFGLVNIPIKLYSATESQAFKFRMLDDKNHSPIKYKRVSEKTGEEVEWKHIVKGVEMAKGKFFVPSKEQLKAIKPEKSETIDIVEFVDQEHIDPIYFNSHYFIGPAKAKEKAFFLFKEVLDTTGRTALGRFVMHDKEYVAAIKSYKEGLLLTTLNYAYEIRDVKDVDNITAAPALQVGELKLAEELTNKLYKKKFDIKQYKDTFAEELEAMLKRASKGELVATVGVAKKRKTEDNLIAALKASLD